MKLVRFFAQILCILTLSVGLSSCSEYLQAETAKAYATAAPYDAAARAAEAQSAVQIAELDTQVELAGLQATAQAESLDMLVAQTDKSLTILEDASRKQTELLQDQYGAMKFNASILVIAGGLVIVAVLILLLALAQRNHRPTVVQVREVVRYVPRSAAPVAIAPPDEEVTQELPALRTRGDYWRQYCEQAQSGQDREA